MFMIACYFGLPLEEEKKEISIININLEELIDKCVKLKKKKIRK